MVGTTNDNVLLADDATHVQVSIIKGNVVIGFGASPLPAVRIGAGATLGAGSVVTKDVAPGTLVAGCLHDSRARLKVDLSTAKVWR